MPALTAGTRAASTTAGKPRTRTLMPRFGTCEPAWHAFIARRWIAHSSGWTDPRCCSAASQTDRELADPTAWLYASLET